jgi:hypothetical protein
MCEQITLMISQTATLSNTYVLLYGFFLFIAVPCHIKLYWTYIIFVPLYIQKSTHARTHAHTQLKDSIKISLSVNLLGAFTGQLQEAAIGLVMLVRPSVRLEQRTSHPTDFMLVTFHIWYF